MLTLLQKIISTAYVNFSTMWLTIVLIVGVLIMFLEQSLETIIVWLECHKVIKCSSIEWFGNETLQLQRMAHEELGLGDWEGCRGKTVPVTQKGQLLAIFSAADPEHPKLINPSTVVEKPEYAVNGDQSSDHPDEVGGSGAEVNESPSRPSQDDNGHSTSNSPVNQHSDSRPESIVASKAEGGATSSSDFPEQRLTSQSESQAISSSPLPHRSPQPPAPVS